MRVREGKAFALTLKWVGMLAWMVPLAAGQSTFTQNISDINLKFDLGTGSNIPPGIASTKDEYGFAVNQLYYANPIATAEGNSTDEVAELFSIQATPQPGVSGLNTGFVTAKGTSFMLNGRPFYCAGTNAYYAALQYIMSDNEVAVMMKEHAKRGASIMRVFAHSNFESVPNSMMPSFGEFNEDAIRRLDLALVAAARQNIRLILVLGNYWPFLGGAQAWVDRGLGKGKELGLFYSDSTLLSYFKQWVKHIVTRTNTITGQRYVDDPTIFAWELLNEPRMGGYNGDGLAYEANQGLARGSIICGWVREMAGLIKSLDKNHMVTTGEEGFRSEGSTQEPHSWINNAAVNFKCNVGTPEIDFATLHTYPDQWNMPPPDGYTWLADNYFKDRGTLAKSLGKPIILEEYGQSNNYYGSRNDLLRWQQDRANENDYACTLVWAVSHYGTDANEPGKLFGKDDQGYVFFYGGDGDDALLKQYSYANEKTGGTVNPLPQVPELPTGTPGCTDTAPSGPFTCQQQAAYGKCKEAFMQGYCNKSCGRCS